MRSFLIVLLVIFFNVALFSQEERGVNSSTLNPVKCPTLSARPAYDLCITPTANIAPGVQVPPGATIVYSWAVPVGANISGGTNQSNLMTSTGGIYTLSAANSTSNCTEIKTYTVIACPTVGMEETTDPLVEISVYPNPCHNSFELSFDQSATVLIIDVFGELLLTKHHEPGKQIIDISRFVNGAYYLKITSDKFTKTVKVLKD